MDEAQLKTRLAKALSLPDVPGSLWDYLVKHDYVGEALEPEFDSQQTFESLVDAAKDFLRAVKAMTGGAKRPHPGRRAHSQSVCEAAIPDMKEWALAYACAVYTARHAAVWPAVASFRTMFLDGRDLAPEEAVSFLCSPAVRFLAPRAFTQCGIPFLGHQACFLPEEWALQVTWGERSLTLPQAAMASRFLDDLRYVTEADQGGSSVTICRGSVADCLRELGAELTRRYNIPGPCAVWWVLTGRRTMPLPVQMELVEEAFTDFSYQTITLTMDARTPAETVQRVYRQAQQELLGKDNRPLQDRSLALAQFMADHGTDSTGRPRAWAALRDQWNDEYVEGFSKWQYTDVRRFARDAKRAQRSVFGLS